MAFNYTTTGEYIASGRRKLYGTYTNDSGSTGGTIIAGTASSGSGAKFQALTRLESVMLTPKAASVVANGHVVNTTLPASTSSFVIVTNSNDSGFWEAIGY